MDYYAEQEFVYEPEGYKNFDEFDDEGGEIDDEELDYGEGGEEADEEKEVDIADLAQGYGEQYDVVDEKQFEELTFANLPFSMKDLYGGPLTSLQQIKMLYSNKEEKIDFSQLSDTDLFKLLVNLTSYSNKINLLLPNVRLQGEIEAMLSKVDKIPSIKYKNPLASFLAYLCVNSAGVILQTRLNDVFNICESVNLMKSDILRYIRMWQIIYIKKVQCD